jgi:hypothetical protein
VRVAVWLDGAEILGRALVLERFGLRLVSRGPIWSEDVQIKDQRHGIRLLARRIGPTVVTPERPLDGFGIVPLVTPYHHAIWDIAPQFGDLKRMMTGKWRNRLSAALRAGVKIKTGNRRTFDTLMKVEAAQRLTKGYRGLSPQFLRALPEETLSLWQWHSQGQMRAAMCFVLHGSRATYLMGWGDNVARGQGVHNAMLWSAALDLRTKGIRQLDLGQVNDEAAPGLAHFKLGTGARLHRLGSTSLILPG